MDELWYSASPLRSVGVFVVRKENGRQLLMVDARAANQMFLTAPLCGLGHKRNC